MEEKLMEEKLKDLEKQIAELKAQLKEKNKWAPKIKEDFYWVNNICEVTQEYLTDSDAIESITRYTKVFKTYEEAARYANYLKAKHKYSYEFTREEWEDSDIGKTSIYLSKKNGLCISVGFVSHIMNCIYFKTEKKAQEFIDKYRKEILEFEFGVVEEWKMKKEINLPLVPTILFVLAFTGSILFSFFLALQNHQLLIDIGYEDGIYNELKFKYDLLIKEGDENSNANINQQF